MTTERGEIHEMHPVAANVMHKDGKVLIGIGGTAYEIEPKVAWAMAMTMERCVGEAENWLEEHEA